MPFSFFQSLLDAEARVSYFRVSSLLPLERAPLSDSFLLLGRRLGKNNQLLLSFCADLLRSLLFLPYVTCFLPVDGPPLLLSFLGTRWQLGDISVSSSRDNVQSMSLLPVHFSPTALSFPLAQRVSPLFAGALEVVCLTSAL